VPGALDNDDYFDIVGGILQTTATFDYEDKNSYNIRVLVTDNGNNTFENIFTIHVTDVNDAPVAGDDLIDPDNQVISGQTNLFVLTNDTDQDVNDVLKVASVTSPSNGTAITSTTSVQYTPPLNFNGEVTFSYTARDNHSGGTLTDNANVTLRVVANDQRGDCNSDDNVNAGDFPAFVLELNDTDSTTKWYDTYTGSSVGSPLGCDANASKSVTISDLTCTILVFFGNSACTTSGVAAAAVMSEARLTVAPDLTGVPNSTVEVPILLQTNGNRVAAASFALGFNENQLGFDATDADGNGVPDAVTVNTPSGMVSMVTYNEDASRLEITVYAVMMPMPTLADGPVATITFWVNEATTAAEVPLDLVLGSLGSDQGQDVPVQMSSSSVQIVQQNQTFYLPLVRR
jgi:hypothetical protein